MLIKSYHVIVTVIRLENSTDHPTSQIIGLQQLYNLYRQEMSGLNIKLYAFQYFRQFMKNRDLYCECRPPSGADTRVTFVKIIFKNARDVGENIIMIWI